MVALWLVHIELIAGLIVAATLSTTTADEAVAEQPVIVLVTVTAYTVDTVGLSSITLVVALLLHAKAPTPVAVSVTLLPLHMVSAAGLTEATGLLLTVTDALAVAEQPLASMPVTL